MKRAARPDAAASRVFDANLNRAREGLRVLEDTARFVMNNQGLYRSLRAARHLLDESTRAVYPALIAGRDAAGDVGRVIREGSRTGLGAVIAANCRRVQESLRVLEEYSRVVYPASGPGFKAARFGMYIVEQKLMKEQRAHS